MHTRNLPGHTVPTLPKLHGKQEVLQGENPGADPASSRGCQRSSRKPLPFSRREGGRGEGEREGERQQRERKMVGWRGRGRERIRKRD